MWTELSVAWHWYLDVENFGALLIKNTFIRGFPGAQSRGYLADPMFFTKFGKAIK